MLTPNPLYIDEIQQLVRTSPFPNHMSMELTSMELDRALVELEVKEVHFQPFNIVHGGVLATLIDTATFWAVYLRIPEEAGLVNIDLKLNYLKPVAGGTLTAEGVAIRSGRTISYSEARVYNSDNELVCHGTSTLMTLPGNGLATDQPKFLTAAETEHDQKS